MDDVFVGQPVVDAEGIMGQVVEVSTTTSRMILLNDQKALYQSQLYLLFLNIFLMLKFSSSLSL